MLKQEIRSLRSFSEVMLEIVASADEVASLAKDSEAEDEAISDFAIYLEKLLPILDTLRQDKVLDTPKVRSAIWSLETELQRARDSIKMSPDIRANIQGVTNDLGRSLGLLLCASIGVSLDLKEKIGVLHEEMMNAKFDDTCTSSEGKEIGEVYAVCSEIQEEERKENSLEIEDVVLQLKYGDDDEFKVAIKELEVLVGEELVGSDWIVDEGIVSILFNRLGSSKCVERLRMIKVLRNIAYENDHCKEKMADVNSLTTLVKSLARDDIERREAVGFLMELCDLSSVRRRIGRIQGCIIMLVEIFHGDDPCASSDAGKLLSALSCNTQNALLMAEAGHFQPLIQHLRQGSEMSKILMATSLSRIIQSDNIRLSLAQHGTIEPLVIMFKTGKLEAKQSALKALESIAKSTKTISYMLESGILPPLLQLLFSVTSSLMTLREPAAAILVKIAQSEHILEHTDLPHQLFSLLNLSCPKIKCHVLKALTGIASHPNASQVRSNINQNGLVQLILPFLQESDCKIRSAALSLMYTVSEDFSEEFTEIIGGRLYLPLIVGIVSSSSSEVEKSVAVGLLSNICARDGKAIDKLKRANLLPVLVSLMTSSCSSTLEESIASVIIRFTLPSDKKSQMYAAECGVIPVLVKLIVSGTTKSKSRAATALTHLSQNTMSLRRPRGNRWCMPSQADTICEVHDGYCTVKSSFCLVKAGAVSPLLRLLDGEERDSDEAALSALATLVEDGIWENGSNFIVKTSGGVEAILRGLELGSIKAKEKALWILERIFRIEDHRLQYGMSTHMVLINLARNAEQGLKPAVARLMAQLELLQAQSGYF